MLKKSISLIFFLNMIIAYAHAQTIDKLMSEVRKKMALIKDYQATGTMKTSVSFLKIPAEPMTMYYKAPDKLSIKTSNGLSFVPKGAVNLNINKLIADKTFTVIDAGTDRIAGKMVRLVKLLPLDDKNEIILSTVYIDPVEKLILKSRTTTKQNGTFELEMSYGKYVNWGLPDKIVFIFNTKDYKLPKGITFDFDDGTAKSAAQAGVDKSKGQAELTFSQYVVNKGVEEKFFK